MPDAVFAEPRLAAVYDALGGDRNDLDAYVGIAEELGARQVVDVGCGTGVLALRLAAAGLDVVGVDPAVASLHVARAKLGADRVRWIVGDARDLPPLSADLAVMTGNVAQAIVHPADWRATLEGAHRALRPDGLLVFETRDPEARDWERWPAKAPESAEVAGVGRVESRFVEIVPALPLLRFRVAIRFASDGAVLTSESTLRFRDRAEIERDLAAAGFAVEEVRGAPDRPGLELVFLARSVES